MVPTRSLEEKTPIWFPVLKAIYQVIRLAFTHKSNTFWGY